MVERSNQKPESELDKSKATDSSSKNRFIDEYLKTEHLLHSLGKTKNPFEPKSADIFDTKNTDIWRKNKDNSYVEHSDQGTQVMTADGTLRKFQMEKGEYVAEKTIRNGSTETWQRIKDADGKTYTDNWEKEGSRQIREGKASVDDKGNLTFAYTENGKPTDKEYSAKTDGRERVTEKKSDTYINYVNGLEQEMKFADGSVRTFTRNPKNSEEITSVSIKDPAGKIATLQKVASTNPEISQYRDKSGQTWNMKFEIKDGQYLVHEQDKVTTRTMDGKTIESNTKTGIETTTLKGKLIGFKTPDKEITATRNEAGEVTEITDSLRNYHWERNSDGTWENKALDPAKLFVSYPATDSFKDAEFKPNGDYIFTGKDSIRSRFHIDGSLDWPGDMKDLRSKVEESKTLSEDQKKRILNDYLPNFETENLLGKSKEESDLDRTEAIYNLARLLEKPESTGLTEQECNKLFEQTAFHFGHPDHFQQALNTCNVTNIGLCLLREDRANFAKLIADIGTTGKYRTADGTDIVPPKQDLQTALHEQVFPLHKTDPQASGASRVFAITAANVHWQRRTVDDSGRAVAKGSLFYRQEPGEGICYNQNGTQYLLADRYGKVLEQPYLFAQNLVDIGQQITGDPWKNKVVVNKNMVRSADASPANKEQYNQLAIVSSAEELDKIFADAHGAPQILVIHTSHPPFHYDSGYGSSPGAGGTSGGSHVITKVKYEPANDNSKKLDPQKSLAYIDNTWNPTRADHLTKERAIPLNQLYKATEKQEPPKPVIIYTPKPNRYFPFIQR